ncbi:alanyl-tRNA editing protein [Pyrococcus yayanosii]|uniref:Alanyl-tRNA synthetase n=1 Tax=Pyrococcus yayanosii (strain CH1 / JCM 16557) TaxID=529709 RepID=F8AGV6_PYRYC|nr:DHHA1 domain-containing protein [Pyrococcus yayanosii]AEH25245.1 alanyl-tRNA synthetase [Pyrococcus yayanosii CH1]
MTKRLYYEDPYLRETEARVLGVREKTGKTWVRLDKTIFYPEGGGQPGDRGIIEGDGFRLTVENTIEEGEDIWHVGRLEGRKPKEGDIVRMRLDWEWRYENMRQHTGQHILSAVLKKLYDLDTTGFQIFESHNKIEVNGPLNWEMIEKAELEASRLIIKDIPVTIEEYKYLPDDIVAILRKHVTKVKGKIRIVRIGDVDVTPCGGTHVRSTREVGLIKVLRFYKKGKNLWRIEFVCGGRAIRKLNELLRDYWESLEGMPNKNPPLRERVKELRETMKGLEDRIDELRHELWRWKGEALLGRAQEVGHYNIVTLVEKWDMKNAQAFAVDFVSKNPGTVLLLASEKYVLFVRNEEVPVSMKELLQRVIDELGGKGGGTDNLAKGRVEADPEDVLEVAKEKLRELLEA